MTNNIFNGGKPFGKGFVDAKLNDPELLDTLTAYRRKVAGYTRPLLSDEFASLPVNGLLVSPKIDGELWFLVASNGIVFLTNPRGRLIYGDIPILLQAKSLPDNTIIAGELYASVDGRRSRVGDLSALLSEPDGAVEKLYFGAFDLLEHENEPVGSTYVKRYEVLNSLIKASDQLSVIQCEEMDRANVLAKYETEVVTSQLEGLIIRLPSGLIYKLKPTITIDAVIIAYTTKTDQPHLVRSVLLGLMNEAGHIQILGGCGNIGSEDERMLLGTKLEPHRVIAPIRYASDSGSLYTFVKPEIVIELKVTDLQLERSDGSSSSSMLLCYEDNAWKAIKLELCPRPIHPVLLRVRDDKSVTQSDIRLSQIGDFLPKSKTDTTQSELPKSHVLRREVWTKETKGELAVRKLLVWKTNKSEINSAFPEYVVHWTDYSSGRASPLNREVKLAPNEESAMQLADGLILENIKKGWNLV